jgi:hypothetical protein
MPRKERTARVTQLAHEAGVAVITTKAAESIATATTGEDLSQFKVLGVLAHEIEMGRLKLSILYGDLVIETMREYLDGGSDIVTSRTSPCKARIGRFLAAQRAQDASVVPQHGT